MTTRLNALEAAYLRVEDAGAPMHIGAIGYFEGAPFFDADGQFRLAELRAKVLARLGALPRLRQRVEEVPLSAGRPVWVDDPQFDIAHHIDVVPLDLEADHDDAAFIDFATSCYGEPLRRELPLWHLLFITGLSGGRVGLLQRVHHSMVDGVGGVGLATMLLDLERCPPPDAAPPLPPAALAPEQPSALRLLGEAVVDRVATPPRVVREVAHNARFAATSLGAVSDDGLLAPKSSLNAPTGPRRRLLFVRDQLDAYKRVGKQHGATVNDVVLTVVTAALRKLLLSRGEFLASDAALKVLVPVSLRPAAAASALGNQVAGMVVNLPIGIGDPAARMHAVVAATRGLKDAHEDAATMLLLEAGDLLPPRLLGVAGAAMRHQPLVNLVVTNIPGPPVPLYALGAELLEAFPVVPLAGNLTLGVAILSYNGALNFCVTADPDACPDADVFAAALTLSSV